MNKTSRADEVIRQAYDCVVEDDGWNRLLASCAHLVGADSGLIFMRQKDSGAGALIASFNYDASSRIAPFLAYYEPRDPKRQLYQGLSEGEVRSLGEFAFSRSYRETEFFQDWVRPQGTADMLGSHLVRTAQLEAWVSLFRAEKRGIYKPSEIRAAGDVAPHLTRAIKLRSRLEAERGNVRDLHSAVDMLGVGVLVLDAGARVLMANRAAEAILAAGGGLHARHGRLTCVRARENTAMQQALREVAQASAATELHINRPDGHPPLMLHVVPISSLSAWHNLAPTSSIAAVFVTDPMRSVADIDGFAAAYSLTRGEKRVLREVTSCGGLVKAADKLQISATTARTHLRHIFEKTDTKNQADLVRLVMGSSLQLRR
jgi:DNA-binding CsgD family transcriptional regulator